MLTSIRHSRGETGGLAQTRTETAGIVLPRSAIQSKGHRAMAQDRACREGTFSSAVTLLNTGGWVFDDVDGRYVVALLALRRTDDV